MIVDAKPYDRPKVLASWEAPSRVFRNREPVWFVGFLLLALIVLVLLVLMRQWSLMLAVLAFSVTLIVINVVEPEGREFQITTYGIKIGKSKVRYGELKWFWFEKEADETVLYVSSYVRFPQIFEMPLPKENADQLKAKIEEELLKYLPYHEEGERNWHNTLDNIISRIEPYLPKSVINWYTKIVVRG